MINFFTNIDPQLKNSEEDNCSICLNEFTNKIVTECGHFFCKECIISCINMSKKECPMCRDTLTKNKIHPIVSDCKNNISDLVARYGTKMGKLIELCNKITEDDTNRIIIFSQWDKMIDLIKKTLEENNIFSVSCKGNVHKRNKAIKTFKEGKNIKTIILSLKNAAAGINLIEGTHIILIDPISGKKQEIKAIESQALGRVRRIGKNNEIKIIRLIIKDTIEHCIYNKVNSIKNNKTTNKEIDIEDIYII
jgi:SNF2 family DNA or RNA helicase